MGAIWKGVWKMTRKDIPCIIRHMAANHDFLLVLTVWSRVMQSMAQKFCSLKTIWESFLFHIFFFTHLEDSSLMVWGTSRFHRDHVFRMRSTVADAQSIPSFSDFSQHQHKYLLGLMLRFCFTKVLFL